MADRSAPLPERLWRAVEKVGPVPEYRPDLGPCWLWTGYIDPEGYGRIYAGHKTFRTHRLAYTLLAGPIPEGLEPDHLCRVRHCVKPIADEHGPAHLEPVTHLENMRRALLAHDGQMPRGVHPNQLKTQCQHGHPFDEVNTYWTPRGRRTCRACNRLSVERYKAKRREATP
jgi:hypothetical protein